MKPVFLIKEIILFDKDVNFKNEMGVKSIEIRPLISLESSGDFSNYVTKKGNLKRKKIIRHLLSGKIKIGGIRNI